MEYSTAFEKERYVKETENCTLDRRSEMNVAISCRPSKSGTKFIGLIIK